MKPNLVIFDRPYPADMQAEGLAIRDAVLLGKCNDCPSLAECSTNDHFELPAEAFCVKRKNEILKELKSRT